MNCNNYFDMTDQGDSFESWQGLRGPAGPQGPAGTPGAPGTSVELRGPVETTGDLPATASSSELWLVGSAAPYHGWFYNGEAWEDAGEIAVGPTGPQGPAGADGTDGSNGVTFTPTVSSAGVISWTNDGSLPNPDPVDIKGPQGETGAAGSDGSNGVTFTPAVSSAGVISWTNDGGLPNPESVNIKGPQGETGQTGPAGQDGTDGSNGVTFTPSVSSAGVISWTNDGGLPNPQSVNIKGPQGETGATGPAGPGVPSGGTAGQVLTKTGAADYATGWQDPSGGDVTADMLGIVIDGNSTPVGASVGQYVIVKNSTISGITDGLYTAAQAIPANTAIDSTYLTAVSGGGLNSVRSLRKLLWINPSPNSAFNAQTVNLSESASNFDRIEVVFFVNNSVSSPLTEIVQFVPGYRMHAFYWGAVDTDAFFSIRQITNQVTGTTVSFANVFHTPENVGTVSQAMLVPWKIYGIKY